MHQPLSDSAATALYKEAKLAAESSYSPYSHFAVGAAVLTADGQIFRGTNMENASYGLTICAERIAIGSTISAGITNIKAIAVYTEIDGASPCGACRQVIMEFGGDIIVIFKKDEQLLQTTIADLLPYAFTNQMLDK